MTPYFPLFRSLRLPLAFIAFASIAVAASRPPRGWAPEPFTPLTPERIAGLPADQRAAWEAYWDVSEALARLLPERPKADASLLRPMSTPPKGGIHTQGLRLDARAPWYASEDARVIADRVAAGQMSVGAWPKGMDYTQPTGSPGAAPRGGPGATFDNDATIGELRYLALVLSAADGTAPRTAVWRDAFVRGLRYVFAAQYPHGGFPQYFPLIGGYHDGITFNDDAMTNVLELLRDAAFDSRTFAFLDPDLRTEAARRLDRGVACTLATQLRTADGRRTVWCQQYDPLTLKPAAARNFEPIADASRESAGIALLLMSLPNPSPEIAEALDGAMAWFRSTAIEGVRIRRAPADVRGEVIPSPGAPPLWARFYEPGTTTPIFGDRDRTVHYDLAEISSERVAGYAWYTDAPRRALASFRDWQKKHSRTDS